MKHRGSLFLCVALVLSGCGGGGGDAPSAPAPQAAIATPAATALPAVPVPSRMAAYVGTWSKRCVSADVFNTYNYDRDVYTISEVPGDPDAALWVRKTQHFKDMQCGELVSESEVYREVIKRTATQTSGLMSGVFTWDAITSVNEPVKHPVSANLVNWETPVDASKLDCAQYTGKEIACTDDPTGANGKSARFGLYVNHDILYVVREDAGHGAGYEAIAARAK